MRSRTTVRFRRAFALLPTHVQDLARKAYRRFSDDPQHPGLRFKRVSPTEPIYSVRIGVQYRALGLLVDDEIVWFWIGSHDQYEELLK